MKLRSISIRGHPGLGDLSLSFLDPTGAIFDTIVLAGGNGTGKSSILEAIQQCLAGEIGGNIGIVDLEFELQESDITRYVDAAGETALPRDMIIHLVVDTSIKSSWNGYKIEFIKSDGQSGSIGAVIGAETWKGVFSSFYSEASINFNSGQINATGSTSLDTIITPTRSGERIAEQIAQLLIDIRSADAEELLAWVNDNDGVAPPARVKDIRFSRFTNAFNQMMPYKRFRSVSRREGKIEIEFEEFGRISTLNQLSTGEKQIIFRAGFLLRDLAYVSKSIVLIDEPELSLHPEWQSKVVAFYESILTDADNNRPQIIFATHSPFIVHGSANARVIILEKDSANGVIAEAARPHYPGPGGSEAVRAFNINSFLASAQQPVLLLTEGESDAMILRSAWSKLRPGSAPFFEARAALGDKNLNITLSDVATLQRAGSRLLVGLFDFDTAFNQWKGLWKNNSDVVANFDADGLVKKHKSHLAWAVILPVPQARSGFASQNLGGKSILSIEFLFEDGDIPSYMLSTTPQPMGSQYPTFKDSEKMNFANLVAHLPTAAFANFEPLLARLEDIHGGRI